MSDHEASAQSIRAEALESLLIEKGLMKTEDVDEVISRYNDRVGPMNGARVVVKAWLDSDFKRRLLANGTEAIAEFDFVVVMCYYLHTVVVVESFEYYFVVGCFDVHLIVYGFYYKVNYQTDFQSFSKIF